MFTFTPRSCRTIYNRSGRFLFARIAFLLCLSAAAPLSARAATATERISTRTSTAMHAPASLKHTLDRVRRAALLAQTSLTTLARSVTAQNAVPPEVPPVQKPAPSPPEPAAPTNPTPGAAPEVATRAAAPSPAHPSPPAPARVATASKIEVTSFRPYSVTTAAYAFTKPLSPALTRTATHAAYASLVLGGLLYALSFRRQQSLAVAQPVTGTLATS